VSTWHVLWHPNTTPTPGIAVKVSQHNPKCFSLDNNFVDAIGYLLHFTPIKICKYVNITVVNIVFNTQYFNIHWQEKDTHISWNSFTKNAVTFVTVTGKGTFFFCFKIFYPVCLILTSQYPLPIPSAPYNVSRNSLICCRVRLEHQHSIFYIFRNRSGSNQHT